MGWGRGRGCGGGVRSDKKVGNSAIKDLEVEKKNSLDSSLNSAEVNIQPEVFPRNERGPV